jgi:hypothetical protein
VAPFVATSIAPNSSTSLTAVVGATVTELPSVIVKDQLGATMAGVPVTFAVTSGGGTITGGSVTTNASGVATVGGWTLGTVAGSNSLTASSSGLTPVAFIATGTVGAPASLAKLAGDAQTATAGSAVSTAPAVTVKDANGNPVSGVTVVFAVASGHGSVTGGTQTTNTAGVATVGGWTLETTAGVNTLTATAGSLPVITFTATGVPSTGLQISLTSPTATNEFIVAIDGGAFGSTPQVSHLTGLSMTSGTLILGVPAGGSYRVRAIAVDPRSANLTFPIMNASGKADNVTVTTGSSTNVAITLAPISVHISAPSTVTAGSQVQISWTYTDPGAALDRSGSGALAGDVFYCTTPMTQDLTGTQLYATGTVLSPTSYQFTITFTAPTTPGTLYFNVAAQTFDLAIPGTSRAGWYVDPSLTRGESLWQITVN